MVTPPVFRKFWKTFQRKWYLGCHLKDGIMFQQEKKQNVQIFPYLSWDWKAFSAVDHAAEDERQDRRLKGCREPELTLLVLRKKTLGLLYSPDLMRTPLRTACPNTASTL